MTRSSLLRAGAALIGTVALAAAGRADPLPFQSKVEVFREKDTGVVVFALRLQQPFLAEELEKSNYLRLAALNHNAFLIYPTETRFHQKHAEFFGRLRGRGKAKLRLAYETVSETVRGTAKVDVRHADLEIDIPTEPGGPRAVYQAWAEQQNQHFLKLLRYHPDESFFQYVLLQSRDRYGVTPPRLEKIRPDRAELESGLYDLTTGSLAVQESLQHHALEGGPWQGDLDLHISELTPPQLRLADYAKLLEQKAARKLLPKPHEAAKLVPEDQYFLHFNSLKAATQLQDLVSDWGNSLLRLFTVRADDHRLREEFEEQLCLRRDPLLQLFADAVVTEFAMTGGDPFFLEGTDVTVLFRVARPAVFQKAAGEWLAETKKRHPDLVEREFHYRGHQITVRYTEDRAASCFTAQLGDYAVYSNSHRAIRQIVDAATSKTRRLYDALDYRHATILLPPSGEAAAGYFYASEAFLARLVGPQAKIAERRRLVCFNNLVMLNNAALFYRLEHGDSPSSLTALVEGRFVDPAKVLCPHGGAYSWDTRNDTCACTLHNRVKYLTPNAELAVLKVSKAEREGYQRFKQRYEQFWQAALDPIAARITMGRRVKVEVCVAPLAGGSIYNELRSWLDERPQPVATQQIARSAVVSLVAVRGRKAIADLVRAIPGVTEALRADPTLTDLGWLGDRVSLHFCDGDKILELDPSRFRELDTPFGVKLPATYQALAGALLTATEVPTYFTVDVEDRDKAARLLDLLLQKVPLQKGQLLTLPTSFDVYRLPEYKKHPLYVLTFRVYALKVRFHMALVGNQLVAATRDHVLKEVIDNAGEAPPAAEQPPAHLVLRLNAQALGRLRENVQSTWSEKARLACHRNAIAIYNLVKLYNVPVAEVPRLAEAKYGVRFYCPEHGAYSYDPGRDQVLCSVHGDRKDSRQELQPGQKSSFTEFLERFQEVVARLRFDGDALYATVEIVRPQPGPK
jgi:hypothetical protein